MNAIESLNVVSVLLRIQVMKNISNDILPIHFLHALNMFHHMLKVLNHCILEQLNIYLWIIQWQDII